MRRWYLTAGLGVSAAIVLFVAPRLEFGRGSAPIGPALTPVPVPTTDVPGHLTLTAGLDRTALVAHRPDERFLVVTLTAEQVDAPLLDRPVAIAVAMDTSGSMAMQDKMAHAKDGAALLARSLEAGEDTFAVVTFADDATVVVPAGVVTDVARAERAIAGVLEGGGTNLYAGVMAAADQVANVPGVHPRVVLLSDGNANVGISDPTALVRMAASLQARGVTLSAVGLGLDYNEDLLTRISDAGGGTYDFVDDPAELASAFTDELNRAAGVEGLELLGWNAERTATGWSVLVGDLDSGKSRNLVARVRVDTRTPTPALTVASATATWTDVIDDAVASASAVAVVEVTEDAGRAAAAYDKDNAKEAVRSMGNAMLDRSARAYEEGRIGDAQAIAAQGWQLVATENVALADPELAAEVAEIQKQAEVYQSTAPSTAEGKRAIKSSKEAYMLKSRGIK
jgi:Ca-activated chloride channel family protein